MTNRLLLAFIGLTAAVAPAFGATNISYTALADPNFIPDATDSNGNTVDVWSFGHTGGGTSPNNYGSFLGNSGGNGGAVGAPGSGAGAGASAWGLYANRNYAGAMNSGNEVTIGHTFLGGILSAAQTVSIAFDGAFADTGNQYGIRLFGPTNFVFALSFVGNDSAYRYFDGVSSGVSAGFGYSPDGFTFSYTQNSATTYSAVVTQGATTLGSWTGTVSGAPDFIQVFSASPGEGPNYDVFANNLQIVPEPGSLALAGGGLGVALVAFLRRRRAAVGATV